METECEHSYMVWNDGSTPLGEDLTEEEAWPIIEVDMGERYGECTECGRTLNA